MRSSVVVAYLNARDRLPGTARALASELEVGPRRPDHASPNFQAGFNVRLFLEHLDELVQLSSGSPWLPRQLVDLQARLASRESVSDWIAAFEKEFDRKIAVLRRTRNALVHGGPFTPRAVSYASDIAMDLTNHALTPAVDFMLDDSDPIDAFLDQRDLNLRIAGELRAGTPAKEALFFDDAGP
jgi:hypothetical protein